MWVVVVVKGTGADASEGDLLFVELVNGRVRPREERFEIVPRTRCEREVDVVVGEAERVEPEMVGPESETLVDEDDRDSEEVEVEDEDEEGDDEDGDKVYDRDDEEDAERWGCRECDEWDDFGEALLLVLMLLLFCLTPGVAEVGRFGSGVGGEDEGEAGAGCCGGGVGAVNK